MTQAEIGQGRLARRGYHLADVAVVPSRRTRDVEGVSIAWEIDAFHFDLPLVAQPSDATMSPESVIEIGRLGGLGVLNGEGLWARYDDPAPQLAELAALTDARAATAALQKMYAAPVQPELLTARIAEIAAAGVTTAVRLSPQHTAALADTVLAAGVDVLVIQGTIVSAEHVARDDAGSGDPLNLKTFIADLDVPVLVGGCTSYQTALHLMRTGAAGIIVGMGADEWATSEQVLGIGVPMATAVADAAAARRDYLDETGGRYVHVVAAGDVTDSGDITKTLALGADAVMLGSPLRAAAEAPGSGAWWDSPASHPEVPRGSFDPAPGPSGGSLARVLLGPADEPTGRTNLFGGVRRAMAKCGYSDLKEFQKVELLTIR